MCVCVCVTAAGKSFHVFNQFHNKENQEKYNFQVTFNKCRVVKFRLEEGSSCECMDCFPLSGEVSRCAVQRSDRPMRAWYWESLGLTYRVMN